MDLDFSLSVIFALYILLLIWQLHTMSFDLHTHQILELKEDFCTCCLKCYHVQNFTWNITFDLGTWLEKIYSWLESNYLHLVTKLQKNPFKINVVGIYSNFQFAIQWLIGPTQINPIIESQVITLTCTDLEIISTR